MSMQPYYLRHADKASLVAALVQLGKLVVIDGIEQAPGPEVTWVPQGELQQPTGIILTGEDGIEYPQMTPIVDANGAPYWHALLLCETLMPTELQIIAGMFVAAVNGQPCEPTHPQCKFAGY